MQFLQKVPKLLLVAMGLSFVIQMMYVLSSENYLFSRLVADDAFYYLKIALNFHTYHDFTFDGLHLTNGVHPFYQYWVTLISFITQDKIFFVRVLLFFAVFLNLVSSFLLFFIGRRFFHHHGALFITVIWLLSPVFWRINLMGLENSLLAVFLLTSLLLFLRFQERDVTWRDLFLLGVILGFGFLTRIDEALWIAIIALFFLRKILSKGWRHVCSLGFSFFLPQFLITLPFFVYTWLTFGRFALTSGTVKRFQMATWLQIHYGSYLNFDYWVLILKTFVLQVIQWGGYITSAFWMFPLQIATRMQEVSEANVLQYFSYMMVSFFAVCVLFLFFFVRSQKLAFKEYFFSLQRSACFISLLPLVPFFLFAAIHVVTYLVFFYTQIGYADKWYFVPEYVTTLILIAWLTEFLFLRRDRWIFGMTVVAMVFAIGSAVVTFGFTKPSPFEPLYGNDTITFAKVQATRWMNDNLPSNARVGTWNAGLVGYLTERPVIHLEGLVNDFYFYDNYLTRNRIIDYMRDERITYLADYEGNADETVKSFYGVSTDLLIPLYRREGGGTAFYVFKVDREKL